MALIHLDGKGGLGRGHRGYALLAVAQPGGGTAAVNPEGSMPYTPARGSAGSDGFTYSITDGHVGAAQGAEIVRNRLPLPAATTDANVAVTVAVLANDTDPDGHALSVAAITQPAHGSATPGLDGTVTCRPATVVSVRTASLIPCRTDSAEWPRGW